MKNNIQVDPVVGQEAVTQHGLGRVVSFSRGNNTVLVRLYISNADVWFGNDAVSLLKLPRTLNFDFDHRYWIDNG